MIHFCFGLPGTGKSTFAKSHKKWFTLDIGHNDFKSKEAVEHFNNKLKKQTAIFLDCYANVYDVYADTYPEYWDMKALQQHINDIDITFAIPSQEEMDFVIERVGNRDGKDSEFYHLYLKQGHKWQTDWMEIYQQFVRRFGHKKVKLISRYDA